MWNNFVWEIFPNFFIFDIILHCDYIEMISKLPPEQLSQLLSQLLQQQAQYQINRIEIPLLCQKHLTYAEYKQFTKPTIALYHRAHEYFQEYAAQKGIIYADEVRYEQAEEFYTFLRKHPGFNRRGRLSEISILTSTRSRRPCSPWPKKEIT